MTSNPRRTTVVSDHRSLKVWQVAMNFAEHTYAATKHYPSGERFGLVSQLRRAAVSIPANIAEGNGRTHRKEYVHHLSIARGSLREAATLWELSRRFGYSTSAEDSTSVEFIDHIGRMLTRMIKTLQKAVR